MAHGSTSRRASPLWFRIASAVLAAVLVAAGVVGLFLNSRLRDFGKQSIESRVQGELALLAPAAESALERGDLATLTDVTRAAKATGVRVTVILPSGEVVAESDRPLPLANHADRPEVKAALAAGAGEGERHSTTVDEDMLYVARRLDARDGRVVGVLRLARPMDAVTAINDDLWRVLLIAGLLGLPVAAAVGWLAARRIAKPLEDMTAAATRMAGGDFSSLPRADRDDEAGRLAEALRGMGQEISRTLAASETGRGAIAGIHV
jgi:two-component system phosphate regulon sensor histidine kinase PhoR